MYIHTYSLVCIRLWSQYGQDCSSLCSVSVYMITYIHTYTHSYTQKDKKICMIMHTHITIFCVYSMYSMYSKTSAE